MHSAIRVGTSGWHYEHWRGPFYPRDISSAGMFSFYADRLRTVEINNSFYHLPTAKAFSEWRRQAPPGFVFAVKASRYITHMKKLKDPAAALEKFFEHAEKLEEKLGPVLFQLPPRWGVNTDRLAEFLQALPRGHRYAMEFRDPSWFAPGVYALLERHNVALCAFELAGQESPERLTADFAYLRLHGPAEQKYAGRYSKAQLRARLGQCRTWIEQGAREVFVYFDNDEAGYAAANALEFQAMAAQAGW